MERLANGGADRSLGAVDRSRELADSILEHLSKMLNTRQGHALVNSDYGMPDITDLAETQSEATDRLCLAIKSCVEKYEPRLKRPVRVTFVGSADDRTNLRFEIVATLLTRDAKARVRFETTVEASGHIRVRQ